MALPVASSLALASEPIFSGTSSPPRSSTGCFLCQRGDLRVTIPELTFKAIPPNEAGNDDVSRKKNNPRIITIHELTCISCSSSSLSERSEESFELKESDIISKGTSVAPVVEIDESSVNAIKELSSWQESVRKLNPCLNSITQIALPGTHDSGTYSIQYPRLSRVPLGGKIAGLLQDYSVTQIKTLKQQAESGVRYFDLRIRSASCSSGFKIHHGIIDGSDCKEQIDSLFMFAQDHQREFFLIKIQFDKDKKEMIDHFYQTIIKSHEQALVSKGNPSEGYDLSQINLDNNSENVLLMTKDKHSYLHKNNEKCWSYKDIVLTKWANTADSAKLKDTNKELIKKKTELNGKLLAISQMQKTALTTAHSNRDAFKSLFEQARSVNENLDDWLVQWVKENKDLVPNIVTSDYFDSFEDGELVYLLIAFNLLDVRNDQIMEEFPVIGHRLIASKKRIEEKKGIKAAATLLLATNKFKKRNKISS